MFTKISTGNLSLQSVLIILPWHDTFFICRHLLTFQTFFSHCLPSFCFFIRVFFIRHYLHSLRLIPVIFAFCHHQSVSLYPMLLIRGHCTLSFYFLYCFAQPPFRKHFKILWKYMSSFYIVIFHISEPLSYTLYNVVCKHLPKTSLDSHDRRETFHLSEISFSKSNSFLYFSV